MPDKLENKQGEQATTLEGDRQGAHKVCGVYELKRSGTEETPTAPFAVHDIRCEERDYK